jgi:2-aminoadipate transaminase
MASDTRRLDGLGTTQWDTLFAHRIEGMKGSAIRELLKMTQNSDIISFAGGLPAPETFPIEEFKKACLHVLVTQGAEALQYGPTDGYGPLKQCLAEKMRCYGVPAEPENILLTNGSQQALDLIGKLFIDPGDTVLTESPTYLGALQAFNAYQPSYVTVPLDDDGMQVDRLESVLAANKVKFIYVLPNFHNPAGTTLSRERRLKLVELAARYGVFIVEDDPYGELRFEGENLVPLVVLHKENVLYLSTFSKTLSPGIRLGWIVAPEQVITRLIQAKQGTDLQTSTFLQMVVYEICQQGFLHEHVRSIRRLYRERRDVMLAAMERHFPAGVTWTRPQGGLFLWVRLPEHVDATEFLKVALQEKVAFVPGKAFHAEGGGHNTMRVNFSNAQPEMIEEGVRRLGHALKREFGCQ